MKTLPNTALEAPEQLGKIAKGISPGSLGRKAEGRVRWAAHESAGLTMKRAKRIAPLKGAPLRGCGAARVRRTAAGARRLPARQAGAGGRRPKAFGAVARLGSVRWHLE